MAELVAAVLTLAGVIFIAGFVGAIAALMVVSDCQKMDE